MLKIQEFVEEKIINFEKRNTGENVMYFKKVGEVFERQITIGTTECDIVTSDYSRPTEWRIHTYSFLSDVTVALL